MTVLHNGLRRKGDRPVCGLLHPPAQIRIASGGQIRTKQPDRLENFSPHRQVRRLAIGQEGMVDRVFLREGFLAIGIAF